jgi:L-malate glycosyltransferase
MIDGRPLTICMLAPANSSHTAKWANHFAERGCDVHILSFTRSDGLVSEAVTIHYLQRRLPGSLTYFDARESRKLLTEICPDILHAHYVSGYGTLGRLTRFRPYIVSVWGSDILLFPKKSPVHASIVRRNLAAADAVCATSSVLMKETARYTSKRVYATPFGVDCDRFVAAQRKPSSEFTIGIAKGLQPTSGIELLIKAYAEFRRRRPEVGATLVIAGQGPCEAEFRKLAEVVGVAETVHFVGQIEHADIAHFMSRLSIYANLARSESFGVAVLEAAAAGVPAVVTRVGGLPEIVVDGETGLIVNPLDVEGAASCFEALLDNNLRERLGRGARLLVEQRFEWEKTAVELENVYANVLATYGSAAGNRRNKLQSNRNSALSS